MMAGYLKLNIKPLINKALKYGDKIQIIAKKINKKDLDFDN